MSKFTSRFEQLLLVIVVVSEFHVYTYIYICFSPPPLVGMLCCLILLPQMAVRMTGTVGVPRGTAQEQ